MSASRRRFLKVSAAAGAWVGVLGRVPRAAAAETGPPAAGADKKLLILGGTGFLGPQLVEAARGMGYTITLFNRGKTRPELFPDLEKLRGDRDGNLKALEGRAWDAVIDTSGYVPRHVRDSATLLKDAVKRYVFVSTLSVYSDTSKLDGRVGPIGKLQDETVEKVTGETYGPLKALCERAVEKAMPGRRSSCAPDSSSARATLGPVHVLARSGSRAAGRSWHRIPPGIRFSSSTFGTWRNGRSA